LFFKILQCNI